MNDGTKNKVKDRGCLLFPKNFSVCARGIAGHRRSYFSAFHSQEEEPTKRHSRLVLHQSRKFKVLMSRL